MTAKDLKDAGKQLEKAKKKLFEAIENKNEASKKGDKVLEARYLGEIRGYEEDVKYYQVIAKNDNIGGGETNMTTEEKKVETKVEEPKEEVEKDPAKLVDRECIVCKKTFKGSKKQKICKEKFCKEGYLRKHHLTASEKRWASWQVEAKKKGISY